ncbi:MAG: FMN-binding glutamate synthase family protein, partial [Pseudomonadota bacterium]
MQFLTAHERYATFALVALLTLVSLILLSWTAWMWVPVVIFGALTALGVHDVLQSNHSILRNYPVLGHMRFLFEGIRPEIRQYLIESDQDEEPFSRDARSL